MKRIEWMRPALLLLVILMSCAYSFASGNEYEKASKKDIVKAQTITAKFDQTTKDGYNYIYYLRFNAPLSKGGMPTLTIENPSLPDVNYTILQVAGSSIRKEFWCKDSKGNEVKIVLKCEENPGARNATIIKMYVDHYPGKRANQQSIDATLVPNLYYIKNDYSAGSVLVSSDNSEVKPVKKWKTAAKSALFEWIDANVPGAR